MHSHLLAGKSWLAESLAKTAWPTETHVVPLVCGHGAPLLDLLQLMSERSLRFLRSHTMKSAWLVRQWQSSISPFAAQAPRWHKNN